LSTSRPQALTPAALALALALATALLALPRPALAKPQWNAAWETAICGAGDSLSLNRLGWCNAVRGDVLFLRHGGRQVGLGPSLRLGTASFEDFRLDAGLSLLLPVTDSFPILLDVGPHLRNLKEPGVFGSVFFGLRSFNHYGSYEMSTGIAFTAERAFVEGTPSAIWITARIDGMWLTLPFIFAYNALR
jgi:hypothetical protein